MKDVDVTNNEMKQNKDILTSFQFSAMLILQTTV